MIRIALIGCTGNIGKQVAEVVRAYPDKFCFSALACGSRTEELAALAREFRPRYAYAESGETELPDGVKAVPPEEIFGDCDVAFIAAGGFAGLRYTLAATRAGRKIALANKESLVCGGELVTRETEARGVELVPVDSEHSAIFQALSCRREGKFERLVLTASGGPFLHFSEEELKRVTAKDALKHPTWDMGAKITIDSATLLNKGYEIIEAKWLYKAPFERIEAIVHPESIVHSLVYFEDGAAIAQLGYPDMRLPIQLALTLPERFPCCKQLDLAAIGALHFERLPEERFPCFRLAVGAGKAGGTCPAILNGAGEVAVRAFLEGGISFPKIAETIEDALLKIPRGEAASYEALKEADVRAREAARRFIYGK